MLPQQEFNALYNQYNWCKSSLADPIILLIKAEIRRNCADLPFISQINRETARNFKNKVENAFSYDSFFSQWKPFSYQNRYLYFLKLLTELFILPPSFLDILTNKHLFFSPFERTILALFNKEHFSFYTFESGKNLEAAYFQIKGVERYLENHFPYVYHKKYGYLTSQYNYSGTALNFRVIMHLPYIMEKVNFTVMARKFMKNGVKLIPFYWDSVKYPGIYVLENVFTLGLKEEEIITIMKEAIDSLLFLEIHARDKAFKNNRQHNHNILTVALNQLGSCRALSLVKMIELLLLIRTGVERKVFNSLKIETINQCLCTGQPAHVELLSGTNALNKKDLNIMRAKIIKDELHAVFEDKL